MMKKYLFRLLLGLAISVALGSPALAQSVNDAPALLAGHGLQPYRVESGLHDGDGSAQVESFRTEIAIPGATGIRLYFGGHDLGRESFVRIISLADGATQELDQEDLIHWSNSSAYFNGDRLAVTLHVAPHDRGVFFEVDSVAIESAAPRADHQSDSPDTVCGIDGDDRIPSEDARVGRLNWSATGSDNAFCTAWLAANGAALTAGHCVSDAGTGVSRWQGMPVVVEYNVPPSNSDGSTVHALPQFQFPVVPNSELGRFVHTENGTREGRDWAVFAIGPNANGQRPQDLFSFFRVTNREPNSGEEIRITGFGVDDGERNQTQQTDLGDYDGETVEDDGAAWHEYNTDTTPGNSGSPIIWEDRDIAMGVHTLGGCDPILGSNRGTSFGAPQLATALNNFQGSGTVHVDYYPHVGAETGWILNPYSSIQHAADVAAPQARISMVAGTYVEQMVIDRPVTLVAPVGRVIIQSP